MADKEPDTKPTEEKKEEKRGYGRGEKKGKRPTERRKDEEKVWEPVTKLGRLVKAKKIDSLVDVFRFAIPIKEEEIVDKLIGDISEEVMEVKSVQKQTQAGQRTRFKAFAIVGDRRNYIGLGWKCHK